MPIALSPSVTIVEKDYTNIVPSVASSACAFAGSFVWGPVSEPTTLTSENELFTQFGKPNDYTAHDFFTAANFLSYSGNLLNIRVDTLGQKNATAVGPGIKVKNAEHYALDYENNISTTSIFAAKYPGTLGNSISIEIADSNSFKGAVLTGTISTLLSTKNLTGTLTKFLTELYVGAIVKSSTGIVVGTIDTIISNTSATFATNSAVVLTDGLVNIDWKYSSQFQFPPATSSWAASKGATTANDELHVVIVDATGEWTGVPGAILEKYSFLSKASNSKTENGTHNFYKEVLNVKSLYVWVMTKLAADWDVDLNSNTTFTSLNAPLNYRLSSGIDDFTSTDADQMSAYSLIDNEENYPLAYIAAGKSNTVVANYLISNIAEVRKDVIVFLSPQDPISGDVLIGSGLAISNKIKDYRNALPSSSFSVIDTGYKYQYDRYNDKYRWVPLNGDIAGLCARTDVSSDPWMSPGGYNRGQIKNVVKLAYNPSRADRDLLYPLGVNPVVSFPGQGVMLYGDKTMLSKPSVFDRIGVRRLFIILEKSISIAAKFQLFEFNNSFTQAQFKNMLEPFLRDIQGRKGINSYKVVCDETNNTGTVVESNNFIADIYIKPNYSISFITLNFIAARQGVSFTTLGG